MASDVAAAVAGTAVQEVGQAREEGGWVAGMGATQGPGDSMRQVYRTRINAQVNMSKHALASHLQICPCVRVQLASICAAVAVETRLCAQAYGEELAVR